MIKEDAIRISIKSVQYDLDGKGTELFFAEDGTPFVEQTTSADKKDKGKETKENTIELDTDGIIKYSNGRIELSYDETELTGMEGSTTALYFDEDNRGLVTMLRQGAVNTVLVFEEGKRHVCVYETEYFPFELTIHTYRVENNLGPDGGTFSIDYVIEIHGSASERTRFKLTARKI
ncbi:MAG: DUF1934 domain-containing protein [Clostridia bacterium]|nr:DUF1934 domain-containing protein [Clostridia bacterium]